jgi:uncharacterized protein DUF3311
MRKTVWVLVVLLAILHFDFWFWSDRTLLFGFLPIGLGYHAGFSIACGFVWLLAVKFAWPEDLEAWADAGERALTPANETELALDVVAAAAQAGVEDPFAIEEDEGHQL